MSEELPRTMLIIKSSPTALAVVETFLRNRGWKIYSTSNMKEALVQMVQLKPSYVLVSVDHPNKKVRVLPKLLLQAFPVATIAFAEVQNSASYKLLNESATDYRVYPPVTGPAIERCVNKYTKDQQTRQNIQAGNSDFKGEAGGDDKNGMISVKGGPQGNISIKGDPQSAFNNDNANSILSQLFADEGGMATNAAAKSTDGGVIYAQPMVDDDTGTTNQNGAAGYMPGAQVQKGPAPGQVGYMPPPGSQDGSGAWQPGVGAGQAGGAWQPGTPGQPNQGTQPGQPGQPGQGWQQGNASGQNQGWGSGTPDQPKSSQPVDPANGWQSGKPGEKAGLGSREYRRSQAASQWAPVETVEDRAKRLNALKSKNAANESLIVRGTQRALEESSVIGDGVVKQALKDTTNAACIIVESEKFSGYLVAVMGKDKTIDDDFIGTVKKRLFKFLKENGEEAKGEDEEGMNVKIKEVDFEPWALEYADFLRKSVHQGDEVAMAFFPRRPIKAILEDSSHENMSKIKIDDLSGDRVVEFDLYVYLPTNDKYVLYTPKGGVFYDKQLSRLKNQGVSHMHVQKDAVKAVSKYHAQNYLNDMIEDYDNKQSHAAKPKAA